MTSMRVDAAAGRSEETGRRPGEVGGIPIEFVLGVAVLLLPAVLLVVSLPTWVERQSAGRVAAREAARTVVVADTLSAGVAAGEQAAAEVAANHAIPPDDVDITLTGRLDRQGAVTATVTLRVPGIAVPGMGGTGGFTWTTTHTERVDRYRSLP